MNNFKRLEEEEEIRYGNPPNSIKVNIDESISVFKFIGNIVELYLPRIMGTLTNLVGGDVEPYGKVNIGHHSNDDDKSPPKYPNKAQ